MLFFEVATNFTPAIVANYSDWHTFGGTKAQKLIPTVRPIRGASAAPREAWAAVAAATSPYVTTRIPRFCGVDLHDHCTKQQCRVYPSVVVFSQRDLPE